ncbi:hypothetical protein Tco_1198834, partial [Tanacetum coccineum]
VTGDGYEGPPVFDDDQYEEEIVSGDVGCNTPKLGRSGILSVSVTS